MSWDEDFDRWFRRWRQRRPSIFEFENIDKAFDNMFREMFETIPRDLYKEERLPDGSIIRRTGPFVYGYSMTMGPDGKPIIREFGNVKPTKRPTPFGVSKPSLEAKRKREPLVDIISEDGVVRVVAEVPGVEKKDIKLSCSESALTISINTEGRKYYKEVALPTDVDPKIGKAKYINGVLEVTLTKVKAKKPTGETIEIE